MDVLEFAKLYYSNKKLEHVQRVANYAINNPLLSQDTKDSLYKIAILHDIIEDTACTSERLKNLNLLSPIEYDAVLLLTHHKEDCSYEDYMKKLANSSNPYVLAVKRADMKDHLMLTNTLTEKLQNKYYPTVKYIL